jgi:ribonucleoside-diphosphate reductase beta chain
VRPLATATRTLDRGSFAFRLYTKAKRLGVWDPADIDLTRDATDYAALGPAERDLILRLVALFQAGEEAVTVDLLPMILAIADEGRIEDELYLTTYLFEEAKHTDLFDRLVTEVLHPSVPLGTLVTPSYREIFDVALPTAMRALLTDRSPAAWARAGAAYQIIVEGTLAETGYHGVHRALEERGIMPGTVAGTARLKQDEARHLAWGLANLDRVIRAEPSAFDALQSALDTLLPAAVGVVQELFAPYGDEVPFGLDPQEFIDYALAQFAHRYEVLEAARDGAPSRFEG